MEVSVGNNYSVIVDEYTKSPEWRKNKLPELKENEVLVEVEASTINPSDVRALVGQHRPEDGLPLLGGKQGVGRVVKTGDKVKDYEGKRILFVVLKGGSWSHYAVVNVGFAFVIDEDVSASSAASGVINPLTVIGLLHEVKRRKHTSIINTAAASALGRMLNKVCRREGVTILNIVRRQQQADLLKSQGAENVIVTEADWQEEYVSEIKRLGSKVLLDALGVGDVQSKLIQHLPSDGAVLVYGILELKNPKNPTAITFTSPVEGLEISRFILNKWLETLPQEQMKAIQDNYSNYLKNDFSSTFSKEFKLSEINEALEYYKENATKGKILLRP